MTHRHVRVGGGQTTQVLFIILHGKNRPPSSRISCARFADKPSIADAGLLPLLGQVITWWVMSDLTPVAAMDSKVKGTV